MSERIALQRTSNGLYLPFSAWDEIRELTDYGEALDKAARERTLTKTEQQTRDLYRRMGALYSTFHQSLYNNLATYGAMEKPIGTVSHKVLRECGKRSSMDAVIINARRIQVSHVAKRVVVEGKEKGFTVRHKRHSDPSFKNTSAVRRTCQEIEDMIFKSLTREIHGSGGFKDFAVKVAQDELIIDRKVMIIMRDRKGRPLQYHTIPPDDVKPRMEVLLKYMPIVQGKTANFLNPSPAMEDRAMQTIYDQFGIDTTDAAYIQEIDNVVTGAWSADQCSVDITAPDNEINHAYYGRSCLERSLEVTYMLLQAFNQNREIFEQEMPDVLLMLHGDVDKVGLEEWKREVKATGRRTRIGVMPTGDVTNTADVLKIRDTPRDMEMLQLLRFFSAVKAGFYRAHPSLCNLSADNGNDSAIIANDNDAFTVDLAQEEGLGALLENTAGWLTRDLIETVPEWEEYQLIVDLPQQQTEKEMVELWSQKTQNFCTIDTALAAQGLPSLAEQTGGRVRGDYINSAYFFQAQNAQIQEMQQTIQSLMSQQPGGPAQRGGNPTQRGKGGPAQQGDWTMGDDGENNSQRGVEKSWTLE